MPIPLQTRMEDMSMAYLQAMCAKNGYEIGNTKHDFDGVDCTIECGGFPIDDGECQWYSPRIDVQLKSSFASVSMLDTGDVQYDIPARNYNLLVDSRRNIPYILILLVMNREENKWLNHSMEGLTITKCAYWTCLKGQEPTKNHNTTRIVIPSTNVLTPNSLQGLMIKVSKYQAL